MATIKLTVTVPDTPTGSNEYVTIAMDAPVLGTARQLLQRHRIRTLDAIQLVTAMVVQSVSWRPGDGGIAGRGGNASYCCS